MATTTKPKKTASRTKTAPRAKSKSTVASKQKGLGKKQWGILSVAGVLVLTIGGYFALQAYQSNSSDAASCVSRTFRKGSIGTCVKYAQILLNYKNGAEKNIPKIAVDGIFGAKTVAATKTYQKNWRLTVDGIVGKKTWESLCSTNMRHRDKKGVLYGTWSSSTAFSAAKSAGCDLRNDAVR